MDDELKARLDEIEKTQHKILNLLTKTCKVLHLLPVTEKEEKDLQLLQRKNLSIAAKVNDELNVMQNKTDNSSLNLDINNLYSATREEVYSDIIGSDFLGGSN